MEDKNPTEPAAEVKSRAPNAHSGSAGRMKNDTGRAATAVRFASPGDGTAELVDAFNAWSEMLTSRSIETAFALIAANWAVHGNVSTVMANSWARASIGVTLAFLGINLVATWKMSTLHDRQIKFAEEDHARWAKLYEDTAGTNDPWPYTPKIEDLGKHMRALKVWAPAIAAVLFVMGLF